MGNSMFRTLLISTALTLSTACQTTSLNTPERFSTGELLKEYERAGSDVRSKYDGKEIIVTGYVTMTEAMPEGDKYEGLISLHENEENGGPKVDCWFSRKEAAEFAKLKGNRNITVKGVFNGESGPALKFCKIVAVE